MPPSPAAGDEMRQGGFTLIELLVTIAVIVIMATIAVPGFQSMMATNRLNSDYNEILSGLHLARSEAIKRRQTVAFEVTASSPWAYQVYVAETDPIRTRQAAGNKINVVVSGGSSIAFDRLGRSSDCTDGCQIEVRYDADRCKVIRVGRFGRIGRDEAGCS